MKLRILILFVILVFPTISFSQSWMAEFVPNKFNKDNGWYFTDDFIVNDNVLCLNGRDNGDCTIVERLTDFPENIRYKGVVSVGDMQLTNRNNFYVLLAMVSDRKDKERRFVALSFGDIISLVELTHSFTLDNETNELHHILKVKKTGRVGIFQRYPFPSELVDEKVCFDVAYTQKDGWDIKIYTGEFSDDRLLSEVKTKNYSYSLAKENFVGFAVNYTKKHKRAFKCYSFSVSPLSSSDKKDPEITPPNSKEDEEDFDKRDGHHIVLSEIMAKPDKGAPEYIEIYNPTTKDVDMSNYFFVYSSGKKNVVLPLKVIGKIKSKEYLVLSSRANEMPDFYKNVISENCKNFKLPVLSNSGFEVGLGYGESGVTFDDIKYSLDFFTKGNKTKSGISLQRIYLDRKSTTDNWEISTIDFNKATPTRAYKRQDADERKELDDGDKDVVEDVVDNSLKDAYLLMKSSKNVDIQINVYTVNGENVLRQTSDAAKVFLSKLVNTPEQVLLPFSKLKSDIFIMSVFFRESKLGSKKFVYKFKVYRN